MILMRNRNKLLIILILIALPVIALCMFIVTVSWIGMPMGPGDIHALHQR